MAIRDGAAVTEVAVELGVSRQAVHASLGRLDVLVNNAGIWGSTPIGMVTEERWSELLDTNLRSAFFAAQRATPALRAAGGVIVLFDQVIYRLLVIRKAKPLAHELHQVAEFLLGGVDRAIDCVGSRDSLDTALRTTHAGGRVVLAGLPAADRAR